MIVYEATKDEFINHVFMDKLVDKLHDNFNEKIGRVNKNELRSWENSLQYMSRVLSDKEIPANAGVAIEFRIPYTSKRVDFLVSGRGEKKNSVIIVELKQWDFVEKVEGKEAIVKTFFNKGIHEHIHPSYQAWSYAMLIEDYNETVQNEQIGLFPCTYLHNYKKLKNNDPLIDPIYYYYVDKAPVFVKGEARKLQNFIKRHIKYGDNKENLYKIEYGRIRPSKSLQDTLSSMLKGNTEYIMIDEQKIVYEKALELAEKAQKTDQKEVLVVEGGPGTGKSVIAINLLVKLTKQGLVAQYVTKNSAPRNVYSTKLKGDFRKSRIDNLFKGSGSYTETPEDEFDALIVDEAHRLNEKSGMFQNLGENQVKEIMYSSKLAIFFIDENQRVTLKDIGSVDMIEKYANELHANITKLELRSQFRCDGSDGYIAWLDDVLQIRDTANTNDLGLNYDVRIYSDPNDLLNEIVKFNKLNNKSRLVAGYCWNWIKEGKNNCDIHDIVIPEYNFEASWNLGNTSTWAIDAESVFEAGCIHTCQGLEFDYVGVIIGDDLIYRDGEVVTDYTKRAKTDQSLKGIKTLMKNDPERATKLADQIIRNTYRTLMTRGQKGCFVFCTDKLLETYLRDRIQRISNEYVIKDNLLFEVAEDKGKYLND
ncbi:DNA/RNA helicase domain-containing protein [Cytobacillus sp. Hz8]|uniref:DNA/RNA helicase domain-containing protein n=1 Tax=Cytobacillus sp. Hz8 TaxID=3347168 RepID=UPI0035E19519